MARWVMGYQKGFKAAAWWCVTALVSVANSTPPLHHQPEKYKNNSYLSNHGAG